MQRLASRMRNLVIWFTTLLLSSLICSDLSASTSIKVIDQNGDPVNHAVVAIPAINGVEVDLEKLVVMDQIDQQFVPNLLVVYKGQKVSFPNSDNVRHNVYSFSTVKSFELKLYKGSSHQPVLYDNAGIGVLGCNIHDNMVAHIYVADEEIAKITDIEGVVTFDEPIPDTVTVWHSELVDGVNTKVSKTLEFVNNQRVARIELFALQQAPESPTFGSGKFGSNRD